MDNSIDQPAARQVQVQFSTSSPDIELPEGKRQLLVPTSKPAYNTILVTT